MNPLDNTPSNRLKFLMAGVTERHEIVQLIAATVFLWNDVVDLKSIFAARVSTEATFVVVPIKGTFPLFGS